MNVFNNKKKPNKEKNSKKAPKGPLSPSKKPSFWNNLTTALLIFLTVILAYSIIIDHREEIEEVSLSQLARDVSSGEVERIIIRGHDVEVFYADELEMISRKEDGVSISDTLVNYGVTSEELRAVEIEVKRQTGFAFWAMTLGPFLIPLFLIILILWFILRQAKGAGMQAFTFGQSKARMTLPHDKTQRVTFKDVAGCKEAKEELLEIVDFLKNPKKFINIGAQIPKGVIMMGAPGTGKCIVGDSIVLTNKGLMEIKDIPKYYAVDQKNDKVYGALLPTLDINKVSLKKAKASHWYDMGIQKTKKITLKTGLDLEGTFEHPVLVLDVNGDICFRKMSDLKEGDLVAVAYGTQTFGDNNEVKNSTAYVMGMLTGDGNLSHSSRIGFTTVDGELEDRFVSYVRSLDENCHVANAGDGITKTVSSWKLKKHFYDMGMSYLLSYDKTIPPSILQAPKDSVVAFLQGLFDTDGSFERYVVSYSTVSKKLSDQVMAMLLNLGIVPKRRIKHPKNTNHPREVYEIIISGSYLEIFSKTIGFGLPRKQKKLEKYLNSRSQTSTNIDLFPYLNEKIELCWEEMKMTKKTGKGTAKIIDKLRQRKRISKNSLKRFVQAFEESGCIHPDFEYLKHLSEINFFFSQVTLIEDSKNRVYDFTVPKTHSFISNGIVSHNTMLARAVAGEARVAFFSISGSEFVEMFVGVGASVTGDTPILIRTEEGTKLIPIKDFADSYYKEGEEGSVKKVSGVSTLGFKSLKSNFRGVKSGGKQFFGGSKWSSVRGVYRHKVDEIYKIKFRGGVIKTTGDHSIFIRDHNMIVSKAASELKPGDILVNLPFKTRGAFSAGLGTTHNVRAHEFKTCKEEIHLPLYNEKYAQTVKAYNFALENKEVMSQAKIGSKIGVSQATVGNWQSNEHKPQFLNSTVVTNNVPQSIPLTKDLMRLFGYYTAEGRTTEYYTQFVFGLHEKDLHNDCISLLSNIFKLTPYVKERPEENSLRITVSSPVIARFFEKYCSTGSHRKSVPDFIWDCPAHLFFSYLEGYSKGDGYTTKDGKLSLTSVSKKLITELAWLCSMHGIQVGVRETKTPARVIKKGGRVISESTAWNLIIGKSSHPFADNKGFANQFKKPIIESIEKENYDGYVYDLCGCDNEAFFGGEKPVLLHNSRVRDLFKLAKQNAPAIIFIDEIDAIGRVRGTGVGGGNDEREQTLNQILVEMDGFEPNEKVIIMAATNRPDVLDPALLRPGRFDRRVTIDLPDRKDREAILKVQANKKPLAEDVDFRVISERTPGFSGADIYSLVNEAAILAARENRSKISQFDLIRSIEKVMLGPERKSHVLSIKEKEITAYHEAGHALIASILPNSDPVHKISIISRGRAAGYTLKLPSEDRRLHSKKGFLDDIAVSLGGYVTEKMIFGDLTTGPSNDLQVATATARDMVTRYGMSEKIGPIALESPEGRALFGKGVESGEYSERISADIDSEVSRIIDEQMSIAKDILIKHKGALDKVAKKLIEVETLERKEYEELLKSCGINLNDEKYSSNYTSGKNEKSQ